MPCFQMIVTPTSGSFIIISYTYSVLINLGVKIKSGFNLEFFWSIEKRIDGDN